jgi:hypothetical protein
MAAAKRLICRNKETYMSKTGETFSHGEPDSGHWRSRLFDYYTSQGFEVHDIVEKPPLRPMERVVEAGDTYDYYSVPLPVSDEDEAITLIFNGMLYELNGTHGEDNVITAFPTDEMLQADSEISEDTHLVVMVRRPSAVSV